MKYINVAEANCKKTTYDRNLHYLWSFIAASSA